MEIDYRAWHKIEKVMCAVEVITIGRGAFLVGVQPGNDSAVRTEQGEVAGRVIAPGHGRFCPFDDIVMMQFTTLRDRAGTKIYDGDILQGKFIVQWMGKGFTAKAIGAESMLLTKQGFEGLLVTGNIYENAEEVK